MQFIRTDANEIIASGHVMRCITIAQRLRQLGEEVVFLVADSYPLPILAEYGFEGVVLGSDWRDMEGEIPRLKEVMERIMGNSARQDLLPKLLVDSYQVTPAYFEKVGSFARVVYMDDGMGDTYRVEGLIAYCHFYGEYGYEQRYRKTGTRLLLGCDYVPLRSEFASCGLKEIAPQVTKVMVTTGGSDFLHISLQIAQGLCADYPNITFYFVIGRFYDETVKRGLKNMAADNMVLCENANMSGLMKECDIAVSAGGTTLYELCACGIPTVCFSVADNQQRGVESFGQMGVMFSCGDAGRKKTVPQERSAAGKEACLQDPFLERLKEQFRRLLKADVRQALSTAMRNMVDGNGAMRIAEALKEL